MSFFDNRRWKNIEYFLPIIVIAISLIGLLAILIATTTPFSKQELSFDQIIANLNFEMVLRQAKWLVIALVVMVGIMFISYRFYSKIWYLILFVSLALLTYIAFFGKTYGGTKGWINLTADGSVTFQPSEIIKIAMILICAKFLTRRPMERFRDLLPALLCFAAILIALLAQMDIGTTIVYVIVFAGMMFVSGVKLRYLFLMGGAFAAGFTALWFFMGPEQQSRIINYLNGGGDVLQLKNSLIAIGSGQVLGKGLFNLGTMGQLTFTTIPVIETDFIFAVIGETFGFLGCFFVIALYMLLIWRMWHLMRTTKDPYGSVIIGGIMFMFAFHVFENIGMLTGIMPITGIPLPFISSGGTNLLTNMIAIGIILSIRFYRELPSESESARTRALLGKERSRALFKGK